MTLIKKFEELNGKTIDRAVKIDNGNVVLVLSDKTYAVLYAPDEDIDLSIYISEYEQKEAGLMLNQENREILGEIESEYK